MTRISHSSRGWKSTIKVPTDSVSGESSLSGSQMVTTCCALTQWKRGGSPLHLSYKALIPFVRALLSWANHLPQAPLPNIITLGLRISTYEFGGRHKHSVYSIAIPNSFSVFLSYFIPLPKWKKKALSISKGRNQTRVMSQIVALSSMYLSAFTLPFLTIFFSRFSHCISFLLSFIYSVSLVFRYH